MMPQAPKQEHWIGVRRDGDEISAMFALPSGRVRSVPLSRDQLLDLLVDASRALRSLESKGAR